MLTAACSEGGTPTEPAKAVLTSGITDLELIPGGSTYIVYSVERIAGHSGAVTMKVGELPQGITATFNPPVIERGKLVSSLHIAVSPFVTPGTYTFTTTATGDGVEPKSIPVSVVVTAPGINVTSTATSLSLEQGTSVMTPVTITRVGGFNGAVGLTVSGLPPGVTATLDPVSVPNGQTVAMLTLTAALDAEMGSNNVTVNASAPTVTNKSTTLPLTVVAGTTPAVLLSTAPQFLQVIRGTSGEVAVNLARFAGYSGAVGITVEGLPAGVTTTVTPVAAGENSTTLTFSADASAALGQVPVTLRASGAGIQDAITTFSLRVAEPPTFRFTFDLAPNNPPVANFGTTIPRGAVRWGGTGVLLRVTGFSESVTLSFADVPPGISAYFCSVGCSLQGGGEPEATLQLVGASERQTFAMGFNVDAGATPGIHKFRMRGLSASGVTREAEIVITVIP